MFVFGGGVFKNLFDPVGIVSDEGTCGIKPAHRNFYVAADRSQHVVERIEIRAVVFAAFKYFFEYIVDFFL